MASYLPASSSSFKSSAAVTTAELTSPESTGSNLNGFHQHHPEPMVVGGTQKEEGFIGSLEVHIHHARDIHNICIYHKQDVYAKICLTSDPESSVSTKTINGGGKNPVFNETLCLNVRNIDASLKCEIWMLSRVKNYLEDQLLGFALVPLSDVVLASSLTQEFSLSSTDLFHSPAGFVQLSLSYVGSSPEVMHIGPPPPPSESAAIIADAALPDSENDDSITREYTQMEFPDLKIVNENQQMVSEYFGIPCEKLDNGSENLVTPEDAHCLDSEAGVRVVEGFSSDSFNSVGAVKSDTPPSSVSTIDSPSSVPATSQSFPDTSGATESPNAKDKGSECEADSSTGLSTDAFKVPMININIDLEQKVVQQDIVDMYMKSMQQFTESLAKMKLPMDVANSDNSVESANSGSDQNLPGSKGKGSRVFYGSSAFF